MINLLSYFGMNLQTEVCMWTLMGLIRTIFDATLFKVNANLKQVWLMDMPSELAMSLQRIIRIVISGTMLVQCFSVYAYLASYIVLLYPVFLEERQNLVLPWLLLAAIRQLLCELTSLALGLGICVLLGASRPPCIKFVISKIVSIMPSLYMWMLVLSYYRLLKIDAAFKTLPAVLPADNDDFGLELAIRRRRTKSLFNEDMLRQKLVNFYEAKPFCIESSSVSHVPVNSENDIEETDAQFNTLIPPSLTSNRTSDVVGNLQDILGNDVTIPRDTDRILEQFVLMLLRVSCYLKTEGGDSFINYIRNNLNTEQNYLDCATDMTKDIPQLSSSSFVRSSYITDFPQIFQRKQTESLQLGTNERIVNIKHDHSRANATRTSFRTVSFAQDKKMTIKIEKVVSYKTFDNKGNLILDNEYNVEEVKCNRAVSNKSNIKSKSSSNCDIGIMLKPKESEILLQKDNNCNELTDQTYSQNNLSAACSSNYKNDLLESKYSSRSNLKYRKTVNENKSNERN